jgi:hypothetical protein
MHAWGDVGNSGFFWSFSISALTCVRAFHARSFCSTVGSRETATENATEKSRLSYLFPSMMASNLLPQVCPCTGQAVARDHRRAAHSSVPGYPPYIRASARVQVRR